jgi:peroxiredoxin
MTIAVGRKLPDATFKTSTADGPKELSTADVFAGRKVVLFGVPGAFTPTCNNNHLPGYIENRDAIRASGGDGKILFLADGSGDFARAAGLDLDLSKGGLGLRLKRFSAIVEDGTVTALNIEDAPGTVANSGAAMILEQL